MNLTSFLSTEEMSSIFTTFSPETIRSYAREGLLPVAAWRETDPLFARTPETVRAMLLCGGSPEDVQ
jgi:hypothetical protein